MRMSGLYPGAEKIPLFLSEASTFHLVELNKAQPW